MASKAPGLISFPRITTLTTSLLVALSSGTNYVFSAYSPQLGSRLNITHTKLNIIAFAGNAGVYSTGPIWGKIVDIRGPRLLLASAFVLLLAGYSGIRLLFNAGLPDSVTTLSTLGFCILVVCNYMTGAGGSAGFASAVNATAKTFPDRARATATGIVISGFGLSAFFFSAISHLAFAGDPSALLLLLSLGASFPMILGFFFIRTIPLPPAEANRGIEHGVVDAGVIANSTAVLQHTNDSHTPLLSEARDDDDTVSPTLPSEYNPDARSNNTVELRSDHSHVELHDGLRNIYGLKLWQSADFWLLFTILSILSGTGIMYINNVGSMSQALYAKASPVYDEVEASRLQSEQVSSISIFNFCGRIIIGLVCDFAKNRLGLPRSYCLVLVSFGLLISQLTAARVDEIGNLWIASAVLGLAYGSTFSLFPNVCIEWFGMQHLSENWGYLSMAPLFAGNLFSVAFGRNLDAHEQAPTSLAGASTEPFPARCLQGRECYVATLHLTTAACFLAILLSVYAGWRERRRLNADARVRLGSGSGRVDVLWDEGRAE